MSLKERETFRLLHSLDQFGLGSMMCGQTRQVVFLDLDFTAIKNLSADLIRLLVLLFSSIIKLIRKEVLMEKPTWLETI